jgi:hypothetical protein
MYSEYDELPLGFSMLFGYDLAVKEYFDTFPSDVRQKISPRRFKLGSVEEMKNYTQESMKKF